MVKLNIYMATSILMLFVACTKAPIMKVYSIDVPNVSPSSYSHYKNKTIKVAFPYSIKEQISQKMNFSYSDSDYGSYLNSEWSNDIAKLLQGTLVELLEKSHSFKAVLADNSSLQEDYSLETNIFTFEHRVRADKSYSVVSLQFTLIDAKRGELIKSKRFTYQEPTPTTDAKGYATATNRIMEQLSRDLLRWIF